MDAKEKTMVALQFGTSGLRDTVENMTDMECYINTRGFISYLASIKEFKEGDYIAIAGDRRPSTYRIKMAVGKAIIDTGGRVDDQGLVPSPAVALYAISKGMPSIMVTGSHIPADRNGIKFTKRSGEVLKSDEKGILASVQSERKKIYALKQKEFIFNEKGMFDETNRKELVGLLADPDKVAESSGVYRKRYIDFLGTQFLKGAKVFLYQHSAVGRDIVKDIFTALGAEIVAPQEEPYRSKEFVPVDTESVSTQTLEIFKKCMKSSGTDIGITLDGDSDRPLLVYRDGKEYKYVTGDILGLLTIISLEKLGAKINSVSVPISSNDAIATVLEEKGTKVSFTKIGSPYVVASMNESLQRNKGKGDWNVFSWESNGGFLLGSDLTIDGKVLNALPTRDAVLPLVSVIKMTLMLSKSMREIISDLPSRYTYADRKKDFPQESSKAILEYLTPSSMLNAERRSGKEEIVEGDKGFEEIKNKVGKVFTSARGFSGVLKVNYIDGIRIYFNNGDISHLRPSGNAPEFRNYGIAGTPERSKEIVDIGLNEIIPLMEKICRQ
ncbi:MAG: phosphomannomutase [Candidatus Omnitrophica bacterium]|nr:phosphomannomutase [Candidatus Omnitrophota bacterium]